HAEERRVLVGLLLLLDAEAGELPLVVPAVGHLELGVAGLLDPLLEEPVDAAAGGGLDGAREGAGLDDARAVLLPIVRERLPERRVAEDAAQHVEDEAALVVEVVIEDVDRLVVEVGGDRAAVAAPILLEVLVAPVEDLHVRLVAAVAPLAPDVLAVGGEAL